MHVDKTSSSDVCGAKSGHIESLSTMPTVVCRDSIEEDEPLGISHHQIPTAVIMSRCVSVQEVPPLELHLPRSRRSASIPRRPLHHSPDCIVPLP